MDHFNRSNINKSAPSNAPSVIHQTSQLPKKSPENKALQKKPIEAKHEEEIPEFQRVFSHLRKVQHTTSNNNSTNNSNSSDIESSSSSASDSSQDSRRQLKTPLISNTNNTNSTVNGHFQSHTINRNQKSFNKGSNYQVTLRGTKSNKNDA